MSGVEQIGGGQATPGKPRRAAKSAELLSVIDQMALNPEIPEERLEKMIRREADKRKDDARRAYDQAMTAMQPILPTISENGAITDADGKVKSTYAEWEDINEAIKPVLFAHRFNLTFRIAQSREGIGVTAVCAHDDGHREETTLWLTLDQTGEKNNNQARASSTSYGKRYTATVLLNLTSRGEDDDGQKSTGAPDDPPITEEQAQRIRDTLQTYGRLEKHLIGVLKVKSLADLPTSRFDEAIQLIHQLGRLPITRASEAK